MKAEILSVGTELLLGDTVNTNSAYLGRELAALGINCYYQTVVGDNPQRLKDMLELALSRSDIVITTGGLGPTYDDLTKETVAEYFGREMVLHEQSYEMVADIFRKSGRKMTDNNRKQALMPKDAVVFNNDRGTANGLAVEGDGKTVIMLPGPPREMTAMFQNEVKPYLSKFSEKYLVSRNIHIFGIGESTIENELHDYMLSMSNPTIAPYAKEGEVVLRVTAGADSRQQAQEMLKPVVKELCERYKKNIYGIDTPTLQDALVELLVSKGKTIATAESCTGGLISKRITEVSGSSEVFGYGICSYANQAKINILGVSPETLEAHGAVSPQTAIEMARGVRKLAGADYGISTTGIAGPTGGTAEKPVGLVYVGISSDDREEAVELRLGRGYGGERELIRYLASSHAINLAIKTIRPVFECGCEKGQI